jgi:MFS family permease
MSCVRLSFSGALFALLRPALPHGRAYLCSDFSSVRSIPPKCHLNRANKKGFTESIIPTAFMTTVSGYYTQREQALRQSWWFSGTGWFTIIGGALNYGFAQVKSGSLAPWQYIYIFAGCITALFGIWTYFLPSSPADAWFLTPEERIAAVERLRAGQTGVKNTTFKAEQIKEALLDVKIWLVAITMAAA